MISLLSDHFLHPIIDIKVAKPGEHVHLGDISSDPLTLFENHPAQFFHGFASKNTNILIR